MTDYRDFKPKTAADYQRDALEAAPRPMKQIAHCRQCPWTKEGEDADAVQAALYRHLATHYDPVSRREDGPGIAKLQKPKPDYSVWGALDVDLLCADE